MHASAGAISEACHRARIRATAWLLRPHMLSATNRWDLHLLCDQIFLCIAKLGEEMRDLDKALADIFAIRSQIAAGTAFRGYGPATVAATGGLVPVSGLLLFFWM